MNKKKLIPAAMVAYIAALVALAVACNKDPIPEPAPTPEPTPDTIVPTPGDTITPITPIDTITPVVPGDTLEPVIPGDTLEPVVPGDTISPVVPPMPDDTVRFFIKIDNANGGKILFPSLDTLRKVADMNKVAILQWYIPPNCTAGWTPSSFRPPRDSLKPRFAISPKIFGSGRIRVNKNYGGASIPCEDSLNISKLGMTACDSAIFAGWGYEPCRASGSKSREKRTKFINNVGIKRAILGKQR